jgi:hypothetical protein
MLMGSSIIFDKSLALVGIRNKSIFPFDLYSIILTRYPSDISFVPLNVAMKHT